MNDIAKPADHPVAAFVHRRARPPQDQLERFIGAGAPRRLAAGETFCRCGQTLHELAFIRSGIVRYFVADIDGNDATKDFGFAGSFTVSFGSATMNVPARVEIAAVTECDLLVWPWRTMLDLYESHTEWQRLGRRVAEMLYVRKEDRELAFLTQDAAHRYRELHRRFGAQLASIPQHQLASYLGIRPQSLARLKRALGSSAG